MSSPPATRALKFTAIYFRLLLRHFGITPELRQGILQGTGVSEEALKESAQLVTLDQQLRQQDNLHRLFGEGRAISAPDLWSHSAFGLLSVASGSAPNLNEAFMTIIAQSDIIGKIWRHPLEDNNNNAYFYYDLDITMQDKHWITAL